MTDIKTKFENRVGTLSKALGVGKSEIRAAVERSYAFNQLSDSGRLKNLFKKIASGKDITIAAVGGSITEGAWAKSYNGGGNNATEYNELLDGEKCYAQRMVDWFSKTFPNTNFNFLNAGIGATPSFLGAFRLDSMALIHNPDLVIVEFAVNDPTATELTDTEIFDAYEAVVRRSLNTDAAVMLVFTVNESGVGWQEYYSKVGAYYNVPMISYHNAIYPESGLICEWRKLSPDNVHPNNVGHALIGLCIENFLENVYENTDIGAVYKDSEIPQDWMYKNTFEKAEMIYAADNDAWAIKNFAFCPTVRDVCSKWGGAWVTEEKGTLSLYVPAGAKRVFVLYFNSNGSFITKLGDDTLSCDTKTDGWEKASWHRVYTGAPLEKETELKIESNGDGKVIIIGLLISY